MFHFPKFPLLIYFFKIGLGSWNETDKHHNDSTTYQQPEILTTAYNHVFHYYQAKCIVNTGNTTRFFVTQLYTTFPFHQNINTTIVTKLYCPYTAADIAGLSRGEHFAHQNPIKHSLQQRTTPHKTQCPRNRRTGATYILQFFFRFFSQMSLLSGR